MKWNLDRLITIEQYTVTRDAIGQEVKTWIVWKENVWAAKEIKNLQKQEEGLSRNMLVSEGIIEWNIRNIGTPNPKMRIIDDTGQIYNIERIDEIGRREGWSLKARYKDNGDSFSN